MAQCRRPASVQGTNGEASVVKGETTETYTYDHADARAAKVTTTGKTEETTRYIAGDVEERGGKLIKYVYLGDKRLARFESEQSANGAGAIARLVKIVVASGGHDFRTGQAACLRRAGLASMVRSGLSVTTMGRSHFRGVPDQRRGLRCCASL
jgi:hypothetical protein